MAALALLVTLLSPALETGFFFTLASLLGAQALLDAGNSTLVIAFMGRAMRHARWQDGRLLGSAAVLGRIRLLTRLALGWGAVTALLAVALLAPLALWLLAQRHETDAIAHWRVITFTTLCALGLSQLGAAIPVALEGTGRVARVARFRARQDLLAYGCATLCVLTGAAVWSLAVLWGVRGATGLLWSLRAGPALLGAGVAVPQGRWRYAKAMWPTQWRLASSWAAGYLGQQTIVPVAYATLGPAMAGRVGLAFFFCNGLLMVSTAWVAARVPELSRLAALRHWPAFDAMAGKAIRLSLGSALIGGGLLMLGTLAVQMFVPGLATRVPELSWLTLLVGAIAVASLVNAIAGALRACGGEPFMTLTLVGGALILPMLAAGAHWGEALGLCAAYFALSAGIGLPWAWLLFARFRRERLA